MNSFYSEQELLDLNFKSTGFNVLISKKASFYGANNISFGDNVRIDDFCLLSGDISIGSNVHIAAHCSLFGAYGIVMEDHTALSVGCTVLSASDDFSGKFLVGPTENKLTTNVTGGRVLIKKYSVCGAHCVILPNITIGEGVAVGAMSLVNRNLLDWNIYFGNPVKKISSRENSLLRFINNEGK